MSDDLRLVLTTCGDRGVADRLAAELVQRRHAACVNVLPEIRSIYRWRGKIESETEVLLLIKTAASEIPAVEQTIKDISGYELPEVVAVEISGGASDYLGWVSASIGERAE